MNEMFATNFTTADWVIVAVYLSGSLAVGLVANRFIHSVAAYLVGGRASGTSLNVATYIGTSLGLVTLMFASIDGFNRGFAYLTAAIIGGLAGFFIGSTGFVVGHLRRLELLTIPEFFERRFGRDVRVLGGSICAIAGVLNMGLFPKMGATFITYATGMGADAGDHETLVNVITTVLILLVLVYTVLGGMVSVIITDYIQFVVLSIGMGLGIYFILSHQDLGWANITQSMAEHRGAMMFNPVAEEGGYGWVWMAFNFMLLLTAGLAWAPEASRALTASSEAGTRRTFFFGGLGMFVRFAIPVLWASAAFCFVAQSPELTQYFFPDGLAAAPDSQTQAQAMPLLLGKIVPTGLLGLLVAGLMAAFMSTHDSYLLCWSSVIARDVVSPLSRGGLTDKQQILTTRISVVCIGLFLLIWGLWYELPQSVWTYMAVTGSVYLSGASTVLVGGIYWRRASRAGALAALLGGLISLTALFSGWINETFGWNLTQPMIGLASYGVCATLFVVFSLLMPDRQPIADRGA